MKPVLLDAGVIVAVLDNSDQWHHVCVQAIEEVAGTLITCEAVIAESCHLLRRIHGATAKILENVAMGVFQIPFQLSRDSRAIQRVLQKYRDRHVDLADACLIHLADEFKTGDILTTDSDFDIYRWGSNKPFRRLIP
ncbi:MAG: PIN domain-containing protein [Bryobacterales bacterium]|nr:PIN domain-containing protein [Bryobacterales bacterium]MBV9401316.1 PIN domain-containing protein [Bryobacterales bacterium]